MKIERVTEAAKYCYSSLDDLAHQIESYKSKIKELEKSIKQEVEDYNKYRETSLESKCKDMVEYCRSKNRDNIANLLSPILIKHLKEEFDKLNEILSEVDICLWFSIHVKSKFDNKTVD